MTARPPSWAVVGAPGCGKGAVIRALGGHLPAQARSDRPACATAIWDDPEVRSLGALEDAQRVVGISWELWEVPGLVGSAGRAPVPSIECARAAEGLLLVVPSASPLGEGGWDAVRPLRDEIRLLDLVAVEGRLARLREDSKRAKKDPEGHARETRALEAAHAALSAGQDASTVQDAAFDEVLRSLALLTRKPWAGFVNLRAEGVGVLRDARGAACLEGPAGPEAEILEMPVEEQAEYRTALGRGAPLASAFWPALHGALGRIRFLTLARKEARAWSIPRDATALDAAGAIHTDLARGFVRAEWVPAARFREAGGWEGAKRAGHVRLVSRDHRLEDGDVLHIHFSA